MVGEATVAVNVTDWPNALGLAEDATEIVVPPGGTTVRFCVSVVLPKVTMPRPGTALALTNLIEFWWWY